VQRSHWGILQGVADALYCNYLLIAAMMAKGVDVLFEQNGSRITDFRRGQSLGTRDHIVCWPKPAVRPEWMTPLTLNRR